MNYLIKKMRNRISSEKKNEKKNWIDAVNIAASMCNYETFSPLKNLYAGRDVVICGAGPSLNNYTPMDGAIHIALNRALLFDAVKFDYFFADDWVGINFLQDEIINYDCKKYLGYCCGNMNSREIPESFRIAAGAKKYYLDSYRCKSIDSKLVVDIDRMAISNQLNIGLEIMQVALFMNPARIFLVGIDASAKGHFTEKGLSKDLVKLHNAENFKYVSAENVMEKWIAVKEFANLFYPNTEIISINPVGLKGLFEDFFQ